MRKIILVAAMALTSAAVHAGELRSLSTAAGPNDAPAAIQTKQLQAQNDAPRYAPPPAETQAPADPARNISDAPRTTVRPAPVDTAPPATASSAPSPATPSTAHPERRYDDKGYYDDAGYHPFPRRYAGADRQSDPQSDRTAERPRGYANRPHYRALWSPRRIIAEMHRYGIYW